jgi:hypothetical protein
MQYRGVGYAVAVLIAALVVAGLRVGFSIPDFVIIAVGLVIILEILFRHSSGLNPVRVYLTLAAYALFFVGIVLALTAIPAQWVLLGTGVLVVLALVLQTRGRSAIRQRRELAGLCPECGYDLRESEERCPECGQTIVGDYMRRRRIRESIKERLAKQAASDSTTDPPKTPS